MPQSFTPRLLILSVVALGQTAISPYDPPADFEDPLTVKIVDLVAQCRQQQVADQCFAMLSEVPTQALTITVPTFLAANAIFCTVPWTHKKEAVRRAITDPSGPCIQRLHCVDIRAVRFILILILPVGGGGMASVHFRDRIYHLGFQVPPGCD
jgi:hypothetical protein